MNKIAIGTALTVAFGVGVQCGSKFTLSVVKKRVEQTLPIILNLAIEIEGKVRTGEYTEEQAVAAVHDATAFWTIVDKE